MRGHGTDAQTYGHTRGHTYIAKMIRIYRIFHNSVPNLDFSYNLQCSLRDQCGCCVILVNGVIIALMLISGQNRMQGEADKNLQLGQSVRTHAVIR